MGTGSPSRTESGVTTVQVIVTGRGKRKAAPHSTAPPHPNVLAKGRSERRERSEFLLDIADRAVHELRTLRVAAPQDPEEPDTRAARLTEDVRPRVACAHAGADESLAQLHDSRARHT